MTPLQHLTDLYYHHHREATPNYPAAYIPKPDYSDKTTNGLTRMILDWLKFNGALAERTNTMGRQINKNGRQVWIKTSAIRGSSDIHATFRGRTLAIEVKCAATRDRIRPHQSEYGRRVQMAGGLYFVAMTFDEFYEWFQNVTNLNN